jgi:hypothetical protein
VGILNSTEPLSRARVTELATESIRHKIKELICRAIYTFKKRIDRQTFYANSIDSPLNDFMSLNVSRSHSLAIVKFVEEKKPKPETKAVNNEIH